MKMKLNGKLGGTVFALHLFCACTDIHIDSSLPAITLDASNLVKQAESQLPPFKTLLETSYPTCGNKLFDFLFPNSPQLSAQTRFDSVSGSDYNMPSCPTVDVSALLQKEVLNIPFIDV